MKSPPAEVLLASWRVTENRSVRVIRAGTWLGIFKLDEDDYSDDRQPLAGRWYEFDDEAELQAFFESELQKRRGDDGGGDLLGHA